MFDDLAPIFPAHAESRDGVLHVGGVSARELADTYSTPVIVYDGAHIDAAARTWIEAFSGYSGGALVAYATKAFTSVGLVRRLAKLGLGADVSSAGELAVALRAEIDPQRIVVHGNNKSREEITQAVQAGAGIIVLDAPQELELVASVASELGVTQQVLVRVNPDVEVETHRYINTAHAGSKFGVPGDVAAQMLRAATQHDSLDPRGVHVHLGSQILNLDPWREVLSWLAGWAKDVYERDGVAIRTLDIGGGLGIAYTEQHNPPTPADVARCVIDVLTSTWTSAGLELPSLIVEPGRSIVGQAALTLYRVGVVKDAGDIRYVNVDGGLSDNPRPVLYQAEYRAILAERTDDAPTDTWWVAGVHCESGDVLIEDAPLPEPTPGELLAVPATGAYAASMASTYNMVPRCAVVVAEQGSHHVLLKRESVADLLARDADG